MADHTAKEIPFSSETLRLNRPAAGSESGYGKKG
jgi:hypothetical protein